MVIKQHEIWMVSLGHDAMGHEQNGDRPFYVISNTDYNASSQTPIGFFMSTSKKKASNRFAVDVINGTVNVSQIRTLSSKRFLRFMDVDVKATTQVALESFIKNIL